jgi:hypothetical protein
MISQMSSEEQKGCGLTEERDSNSAESGLLVAVRASCADGQHRTFGLRHNSEYARARQMLREETLVAVYPENDPKSPYWKLEIYSA